MPSLDQYIHAATSDNTRQSYRSAVRHFEVEWGGFLPSTADAISRYLASYAKSLAINTLRQRLAALSQWHIDQGFPDPTKSPIVRKTFRGIQRLHPTQEKRAKPLQLDQLEQITTWLDGEIATADATNDPVALLRHTRDKAIVLLGFWRGFRGDELVRLEVQYVTAVSDEGITCYLPQTKSDRQFKGSTFKTPALSRLCPVSAYQTWIDLSGLESGTVFRSINRWGKINANGLNPASIIPLLRSLFGRAGLLDADEYSAHSLRRGFANWATSNGWDIKTLMEYVGWKNIQSAMRYVDGVDPFNKARIEHMLAPLTLAIEPDEKSTL